MEKERLEAEFHVSRFTGKPTVIAPFSFDTKRSNSVFRFDIKLGSKIVALKIDESDDRRSKVSQFCKSNGLSYDKEVQLMKDVDKYFARTENESAEFTV